MTFVEPKSAFNLEKETKIINPHPVESKTTNANTFTGTYGPAALA